MLKGGLIVVAGALSAKGTAASCITFTSANDDSVGGSLAGSDGKPRPATGTASSSTAAPSYLDHVAVRYAGADADRW